VKGIVHDQSASGATVFIEPLEILEANNTLREAELAESAEVQHVLDELSRRVERAGEDLDSITTALAALDLRLGAYVPRRVHGHVLARTALAGLTARLARMTAAERAALPGLDPGRGAILPAGALVLERVAGALGADRIVVSDHGVRHAYLRAALARDGLPADFGELWP